MAWRRSGDKPLSEPVMVGLLTHICVTVTQYHYCWSSGAQGAKAQSNRSINIVIPEYSGFNPARLIYQRWETNLFLQIIICDDKLTIYGGLVRSHVGDVTLSRRPCTGSKQTASSLIFLEKSFHCIGKVLAVTAYYPVMIGRPVWRPFFIQIKNILFFKNLQINTFKQHCLNIRSHLNIWGGCMCANVINDTWIISQRISKMVIWI